MKKTVITNRLLIVMFLLMICPFFILAQGESQQTSSSDEVLSNATDNYYKGDFKKSIDMFSSLINNTEKASDLYATRALVNFQDGNTEEAHKDMTQALEIDSTSLLVEIVRLQMIFSKGKSEDIRANKESILKLMKFLPDNQDVMVAKAMYDVANQDMLGALNSLDNAIALSPSRAIYHNHKGNIQLQTKNIEGARESYMKALALNPSYIEARKGLGITLMKSGMNDQALIQFNTIITDNPNDIVALHNRGLVKNNLSDFEGAILDFDKVIELDNTYVDAFFNRSQSNFMIRKFSLSINDLNLYLEFEKSDGVAFSKRALAKIMVNDREGACEDFSQAVKLGDASAESTMKSFCN